MVIDSATKVPEVTLGFWVIKVLATTLGETGGDSVTMTWLHADVNPHNGGYLIGTGIFIVVFVAAVIAQILVKKFNPWIYWLAIVASTTVGTAMADFFDRSLGIGYTGLSITHKMRSTPGLSNLSIRESYESLVAVC